MTKCRPIPTGRKSGDILQVFVKDNNVDQALKVLKKKMQREGVFREMKLRKAYEKPSEKKARQKAEAVRRARKAARKSAQREGLIPGPKKKPRPMPGRPAAAMGSR
jgi:small subunit ribosomal protein S21